MAWVRGRKKSFEELMKEYEQRKVEPITASRIFTMTIREFASLPREEQIKVLNEIFKVLGLPTVENLKKYEIKDKGRELVIKLDIPLARAITHNIALDLEDLDETVDKLFNDVLMMVLFYDKYGNKIIGGFSYSIPKPKNIVEGNPDILVMEIEGYGKSKFDLILPKNLETRLYDFIRFMLPSFNLSGLKEYGDIREFAEKARLETVFLYIQVMIDILRYLLFKDAEKYDRLVSTIVNRLNNDVINVFNERAKQEGG